MWHRCKRPQDEKIQFSVTADLKLFHGTIYAAYVPQSELVIVGSCESSRIRRPKGSEDCDITWTWKSLLQYVKQKNFAVEHWEWWVADNPHRLPRYRRTERVGLVHEIYGIQTRYYRELPELVRKFWRNTAARLFRFVDSLALSQTESAAIASYAQQWTPCAWFPIYYEETADYLEWIPPSNLFEQLKKLAHSDSLPIEPTNLLNINNFAKLLVTKMQKRYSFLDVPLNGLLTFILVDRIVEVLWNGSTNFVLEYSHVYAGLNHWLDETQLGFPLDNKLIYPPRSIHLPHVFRRLHLRTESMGTAAVLENEIQFLESKTTLDPNYMQAPDNLIIVPRLLYVPLLPILNKSERTCAFLYSILQSEHFAQSFTERAYLPSILHIDGRRYVLSMLANATAENIMNFLQ